MTAMNPCDMPGPYRQGGFAAIAAVFLVVVLAALGAFMVTFSNTQQLTSAQDIQGTRAYWAARAGLEWGIGWVAASPVAGSLTVPSCPGALATVGTDFDGGLTVVTRCQRFDYTEGATVVNRFIFQFMAEATTTGSTPGSIGYIQRSISASMECVRNEAVPPATLPTYACG